VYRTGARLQAKGISGLVSEPHSVWHAFVCVCIVLVPDYKPKVFRGL
jgi:hypothetical protein